MIALLLAKPISAPRPHESNDALFRCWRRSACTGRAWVWRFASASRLDLHPRWDCGRVATIRIPRHRPDVHPRRSRHDPPQQHPARRMKTRVWAWQGRGGASAQPWPHWQSTSPPDRRSGAHRTHRRLINLFNLLPIWQLDGGRGVNPLSRMQRGFLCALVAVLWLVTHEGLLILILLGLAYRAWQKESPRSDRPIAAEFAALLVILSLLTMIRVSP